MSTTEPLPWGKRESCCLGFHSRFQPVVATKGGIGDGGSVVLSTIQLPMRMRTGNGTGACAKGGTKVLWW